MVYKEGKTPSNARVDIDYSKGKPKVKFSYPTKNPKKDAFNQHRLGFPFIFLVLLLWFVPYFYFLSDFYHFIDYPTDCNVSLNEGYANISILVNGFEDGKKVDSNVTTYSKWVEGVNLNCIEGNYSANFKREVSIFEKDTYLYENPKQNNLIYLSFFIYFFILAPLLIYLLNNIITKILLRNERYCKWFPKAQANGIFFKTKLKRYKKYYSKDVLDNVIILPSFSNVELDYKTSKDFSKYLEKIKIREHRIQKINIKNKKIKKEKINHYRWYVIFYFKQKPKKGYLELIYQ